MRGILNNRLVASTAFAAFASLAAMSLAGAAVPGTMVVEGLLSSSGGGAAADGDYVGVFSLYNVQSGGSAAWSEGAVSLSVKNGQFSHVLGAKTPLTADLLGKLTTAWVGLKVGSDPELPRQPLRSVAYALMASAASNLSCSGCLSATQLGAGVVSADKVGFTYAGAKTKGGPANSALDLTCTGCVTVAEMKFDKDVNLGGNALVAGKVTAKDVAATTVQATSYLGDGSKLTGIKIPSGECKTKGEVVKGINPDGTLKCVAAMDPSALPGDGIDEISNYLIHNQFVDKTCGKANVKIPDNNPTGVADELTFPDIGLAQQLDIDLTVTNSNLTQVTVKVYDPNNVEYTLIAKSAKGTTLTTSFPSKTKPIKGDLTTWVNKNPKGKWRILAVDGAFLNNTFDGAIVSWCVRIQTLSNKKVQIKGDLIVDGTITNASLAAQMPVPSVLQTRVYSDYSSRSTGNGGYYYFGGSTFANAIKPQKADSIILISINYFGESTAHDLHTRLQYSINNGGWNNFDLPGYGQSGTMKLGAYPDSDYNSTPHNVSTQVAKAFNTTSTISFRMYHFNGGTFYHNRSVNSNYESGPSTLILQELSAANSSYVKR